MGDQNYGQPADLANRLPTLFSALNAVLHRKVWRIKEHAGRDLSVEAVTPRGVPPVQLVHPINDDGIARVRSVPSCALSGSPFAKREHPTFSAIKAQAALSLESSARLSLKSRTPHTRSSADCLGACLLSDVDIFR